MQKEDSKKFLALLGKYQTRIHAYILYQVPDKNDAEDILQNTIVVMLDKFSDFEEGSNFLAWGLKIARYKILAFREKNYRSKVIFDDAILDIFEKEAEIQEKVFKDESEKLPGCIGKLPDKYKSYLRFRYEKGMSYREIGENMSISSQAVNKTMNRIHVILMNCVKMALVKDS